MAETGTLQQLLPSDYKVFMSLPEDEKYKLKFAVPKGGWVTYLIPSCYESKVWDAEEKEAVIQGKLPCPLCKGNGTYEEIQVGIAKVKEGTEIVSRKVYRAEPRDCQCQIWRHVWKLVKRELPAAYRPFSLATLKPDLMNRLSPSAQQIEIDFIREHSSENFLLLGPSGTGKTTLAYALFRAAFERDSSRFWSPYLKGIEFRDTRWIWRGNFNDLLNQFNTKQRDKEGDEPEPEVTQQKIKNAARDGYTPTLIIEEVDKIDLNSHRVNFLFHLIDETLNANGQLVLTSNLTLAEFRKNLTANSEVKITGETIIRRLTDRVNVRNYFRYF